MFGKKDNLSHTRALTAQELQIRSLDSARRIGALVSTLALLTVLGFQVYHSLVMTDIMPLLGVGSATLISLTVILLPHTLSGIVLLSRIYKWMCAIGVLCTTILTLVTSYVHISGVFVAADDSWAAQMIYPLSMDLVALIGYVIVFAASDQRHKILAEMDEQQKNETTPLTAPQRPENVYSVTEVKESVKTPQNRSEGRTEVTGPKKLEPKKETSIETKIVKKEENPSKTSKTLKIPVPRKEAVHLPDSLDGVIIEGSGGSFPAQDLVQRHNLSQTEAKWLIMVHQVGPRDKTIDKIQSDLKEQFAMGGNRNTVSKVARILREIGV